MQAIYARTAAGKLVKGLSFEDWNDAIDEWTRLDEARRSGLFPQVKHFEVRDTDDPKYADAGRDPKAFARVITPRGFADEEWTKGRRTNPRSGAEKAARVAWKKFCPTYKLTKRWSRGDQGLGGWYYSANGSTVAQGLRDLAVVCERRNLIVEGQDGRWYVTEIADPTHFDSKKEVAV